jgi:hypothetical protein
MRISKTNYLDYLQCPQFAWLEKHKPDAVDTSPSGYERKLIRDGYEVEDYARNLFPEGKLTNKTFTKNSHPEDGCLFQPTFVTEGGFETRPDILEKKEDGSFNIYEVKSSTSIKQKDDRDHIRDTAFQKIVIQRCGVEIKTVNLIHLNGDYVRGESLNVDELFVDKNITDRVDGITARVKEEMEEAKSFLTNESIDESYCDCRVETRNNHCDTFAHFNGSKHTTSIYNIPRIGKNKLRLLLDKGITDIKNVPPSFDLTDKQQLYVDAVKAGEPKINEKQVEQFLSKYKYSLHFLDYETYQPAVPKLAGTSPHDHIPFQASLHVLKEDGGLEHYEYLTNELTHPKGLAEFLFEHIEDAGSIVVWDDRFERNRNKQMGNRFGQYQQFFSDINERTLDLQDIFHEAYVHPDAGGRTSLKSVYPALLSDGPKYEDLSVQGGTMAMHQWEKMVTDDDLSKKEMENIEKDLLEYCKLDTLSMVKVYQYLASEYT